MHRFLALAVFVVGCGPQSDLAQSRGRLVTSRPALKPNVMVLFDRSGSMLLPVEPSDPNCPSGCGNSASNTCPTTCPTRLSEAKRALGDFFAHSSASARVGLTLFPTDNLCGPPTNVQVELPPSAASDDDLSALEATAFAANEAVQAVVPSGGTPTAAALHFVGTLPSLRNTNDGRDEYVVLITDGLPNCNDAHNDQLCSIASPTPQQLAACACTTSTCSGALCSKGCADTSNAREGIAQLSVGFGIRTVVIGLGQEVSIDVSEFDRLADGAEFGAMRVRKSSELTAALDTAMKEITPTTCSFRMSQLPANGDQLVGFLDGARFDPSLMTIKSNGDWVTLDPSLCAAGQRLDFRIEGPTP